MGFLDLDRLEKSFNETRVVRDFSLSVEKGEFVSFLGPSGCGKTTTLRMIAGFETPTSGAIRIGGQDVVNVKPNRRNIGMVFQSYALFPNLTVAQNVAFGLKVSGAPRDRIAARVDEMLAMIGLPDLGGRYPFQLSGGQQQRVALARALAPAPQVLLLDEPLSALDAQIRVSLRSEIRAIQQKLGITTIYVTHDQEEALSMSDRIVVMHKGIADQVGTPSEIYNSPATRFVASFIGTLNQVDAVVEDPANGTVEVGGQRLVLGRALGRARGARVALAVRPQALRIGAPGPGEVGLSARVVETQFLGAVQRIVVDLGGAPLSLDAFNRAGAHLPQTGSQVTLSAAAEDVLVLVD
ncbi:ABC transporter ATP-binding protein [Thetidibacter halocola]|uniref:ABC transporter ATP-binding protein n=1 Tax=Thetidibacter halocola TaxID=2827239 RepID=A0A8J7WAR3_9RHOB|nr:ABC transporter ATP-binding protein [Thetidibacter halocola]MBS0123297.1 ABC transporter ATP-binding protein [Thetidibacter halocola]